MAFRLISFLFLSTGLALAATSQKFSPTLSATLVDGNTGKGSTPAAGNLTQGDTFLYAVSNPNIPAKPTNAKGKAINAGVYSVDLFDTSTANIKRYKDEGKKVLCYFSAGSFEDWRADKADFLPKCYCNSRSKCALDPRWQGEWWLDLHSKECVANVQKVMGARIALAAKKGCYGVDPDNTDSHTQDHLDYGTTEQNQFDFLTFLSKTARNAGLAITLKNSGDLLQARTKDMLPLFDGAIIEECLDYKECNSYLHFVKADKPAWVMEYDMKIKCDASTKGMQLLQYDKSQDLAYSRLASTMQC